MKQIRGQSLAGTCAKGTLRGLTHRLTSTGGLALGVIGAMFASMLLIDLPIPTRRATESPYVPAAERWIEPGAESHTGSSSAEAAVVDAARNL